MKAQTSILAAITCISSLVACNSNDGQKQQEDSTKTNPATSATVEKPAPGDKLIGKWVQPIPGQEPDKQGIQLNSDGTATSINMHTLIYEKWELKGDTLIMWNHTTGVKAAGPGIDTTIVKQVTDSTLILLGNGGMELSYTREK
ncbi:MAG TPA: lipocalin family protein [Chitinophaga sp.]|uniref:lipocalin family protein n=1 Tax=Chitinophaga sp. TaxID=1869181 RepID=UPI002D111A7A|nr:lipocalin family protein [Chitinophaga sp.]HVI46529.1 lipocalin family protein [Chitinophaga sp.]